MPLYKCGLCNYSTNIKCHLARHEKSKKHRNKCIALNAISKEHGAMNTNEHEMNTNEHEMNTNEHEMNTNEHEMNTKIFKCLFCSNLFNSKASCRRHEKHYCKENPNFVDKLLHDKNKKITHLLKEKEDWETERQKLYMQVSTLLDKVGDTNIQNNIILKNYGNEDLSHITDTLKTELLKIPYGAIPKMIEAIHFNDEKPENKNIFLPNKKENLVKVREGDKWVYKNKNETISHLVDSKYTIIDAHYEDIENTEKITPYSKSSFIHFRKIYEEGDVEMIERLAKECEMVMLNNR
jgi:hypothetical protein